MLGGQTNVEEPDGLAPDYNKGEFKQGMPEHSGAKDIGFAAAFILHLVAIVVLAVVGQSNMSASDDEIDPESPAASLSISGRQVTQLVGALVVCAVASVALAVLWLWAMRKYPLQLIYASMVILMVFWIGIAIFMLYSGQIFGAVFGLIGAAITGCVWYMNRHRIPFAAALLGTVARVTRQFPGTLWSVAVALLVQVAWSALWSYASIGTFFWAEGGVAYVVYVFLLLSFYWTAEVIRNSAHVTVSGVFATWYFMGGNNQNLPSNPTLKSGKRALTTSFGSICFGSLIVAIIQTVRALLRSLARQSGDNVALQILVCLIDCLLGCIESLVRLFNKYAYVQVAVYGKSFCTAAKDTWRLVGSHGIQAIIAESFTGAVLAVALISAAIFGFAVGAAMGAALSGVAVGGEMADYSWLLFAILGLFVGMVVMNTTVTVVDSGIATIFVCFAMDREALGDNDPALLALFTDVAGGARRASGVQHH